MISRKEWKFGNSKLDIGTIKNLMKNNSLKHEIVRHYEISKIKNIFAFTHLLGRLHAHVSVHSGRQSVEVSSLPSCMSWQCSTLLTELSQQHPNTHLRILGNYNKEICFIDYYIIVFMYLCVNVYAYTPVCMCVHEHIYFLIITKYETIWFLSMYP